MARRFRNRRRRFTRRRRFSRRLTRTRMGRKSWRIRKVARIDRKTIGGVAKKVIREFHWGSIDNFQNGTTSVIQFVQPGNLNSGGQPVKQATTLPLLSGTAATYGVGLAAQFSLNDLPATFQAFIRQFNFYRLETVTLKFKPRWNNTGQDTLGLVDATQGAGGGAPRLYLHTQHDYNKIVNETIADGEDILKYSTHTIMDLNKEKLYHIKPSVTFGASTNNGSGPGGTGTGNAPAYRKWIDSSIAVPTTGQNEVVHDGLQLWLEWENPPLVTVTADTTSTGTVIDIFATYTFSVKELEE